MLQLPKEVSHEDPLWLAERWLPQDHQSGRLLLNNNVEINNTLCLEHSRSLLLGMIGSRYPYSTLHDVQGSAKTDLFYERKKYGFKKR
jgi:hypothetical protein